MYLNYKNKKRKEEILEKAYSIKFPNMKNVSLEKNKIMKGNNFYLLSYLLQIGFKEKIDLIYIDPPFSTNLNFIISENRISTISSPKKGILAYSDKLTDEEYLEFIRERIILLRELLSEQGSFYFHIDTKIGHYIKLILDEIFGRENFINDITRKKSNPKNFTRKAYGNEKDVIFFYVKNKGKQIWNDIKIPFSTEELEQKYKKIQENGRRYNTVPIHAPGETEGETGGKWREKFPPKGRHWRTSPNELDKLDEAGLIEWSSSGNPRLKKFADENTGKKIQDIWLDYKDPPYPDYPTQKNINMLDMIVRQSSDINSIVLDAFAGSGNTLIAAQNNQRKFIAIDESELAISIIKNKLSKETLFDTIEYIEYP